MAALREIVAHPEQQLAYVVAAWKPAGCGEVVWGLRLEDAVQRLFVAAIANVIEDT